MFSEFDFILHFAFSHVNTCSRQFFIPPIFKNIFRVFYYFWLETLPTFMGWSTIRNVNLVCTNCSFFLYIYIYIYIYIKIYFYQSQHNPPIEKQQTNSLERQFISTITLGIKVGKININSCCLCYSILHTVHHLREKKRCITICYCLDVSTYYGKWLLRSNSLIYRSVLPGKSRIRQ